MMITERYRQLARRIVACTRNNSRVVVVCIHTDSAIHQALPEVMRGCRELEAAMEKDFDISRATVSRITVRGTVVHFVSVHQEADGYAGPDTAFVFDQPIQQWVREKSYSLAMKRASHGDDSET